MPDARPSGTTLCFTSAIQSRARFFSLMIERDLFGTIRLVRNWGAIGSKGQEKVDIFPTEAEAARALEGWAETQRQEGYADL